MLTQYTKEDAERIADGMRNAQIATCSITMDRNDTIGNAFVLSFTKVDEYEGNVRKIIESNLNKAVGKRISALRMIVAFIEAAEEDNVSFINMNFDMTKQIPVYTSAYSFKNTDSDVGAMNAAEEDETNKQEDVSMPEDTGIVYEEKDPYEAILEDLKDVQETGLYVRKQGSGKQKKYVQQSAEEIIEILKSLKQ